MKHGNSLPVRSLPERTEILRDYAYRVAFENGYESFNFLGKALGIKITPKCFIIQTDEHEEFKNVLRRKLQLTKNELARCEVGDGNTYQVNFAIKDFSANKIRFCIECFKESPRFNKDWRLAHITHCTIHSCKLVDTCPTCDRLFLENTQFFEECPRCHSHWEDICMIKEPIPDYQVAIQGRTKKTINRFLEAFYKMLVFVLRPFDLHVESYQTLPNNEGDLSLYFSSAYAMLVDKQFAQRMLERRERYLISNGQLTHTAPLFAHFNNSIRHYIDSVSTLALPQSETVCSLPTGIEYVPVNRRRPNLDLRGYPFQIDLRATASLLGVESLDVSQLVSEEVLTTSILLGTSRGRWFDIREVDSVLNMLNVKVIAAEKENEHWLCLFEMKKMLRRYNLSFAKAVSLLIRTKQEFSVLNKDWRFSELQVCREKAVAIFEQYFNTTLAGPIRKQDIQLYFNLSGKQFQAFKSMFTEQLIYDKTKFGYIPGEAIKPLLDSHIILNKHCKFQHVILQQCVAELKAAGLVPAIPAHASQKLYIYKKSHHFNAALAAITRRISRK